MFEALCSSRGQRLLRKLEQPERDISIGLIASFCIASVEERNAAGYRLLNGLQGLHVRVRSGSREVFFAMGWTAPSKLGESAMQPRGERRCPETSADQVFQRNERDENHPS